MNIYPFIMAGWLKRLVNDILGVLREAQDVEEGHAHIFDLMESAQETGYFASQCGWEVEWVLRPRSFSSADGDIVSRIARLVSDYEGTFFSSFLSFSLGWGEWQRGRKSEFIGSIPPRL